MSGSLSQMSARAMSIAGLFPERCLELDTLRAEVEALRAAQVKAQAHEREQAAALEAAQEDVKRLRDRLERGHVSLRKEVAHNSAGNVLAGRSPILRRALALAEQVAATDSTVLLLGETGTGKERFASYIHEASARRSRPMVRVNCSAIPVALIESELFGREKGAYTGALARQIGRFELAHGSTLFLDEIGDLPLDMQVKLLRVLQDHVIERLGNPSPVSINVRIISATNRDLDAAVRAGTFRSDLFYRLNVFPIRMPSLNDRKTDIPLLVRHFVQKFARRMNKQIEIIPSTTMNALVNWEWPGNVRELENLMERSVILSDGRILNAPLAELGRSNEGMDSDGTLESLERQYIIRVLRETNGTISGPHGAAVRLGMKPTTLQSRILRMGISRQEYE